MSKGYRRCLPILLSAIALLFAFNASAQLDCAQCDPYTNHCSDECDKCTHQGIDGCDGWTTSTCGAIGGIHNRCLQDGCDPAWTETSRVTQGTYDGNSWNSCTHHLVQWVTLVDYNHCNLSDTYWTQNYCDNVIDDWKNGGFYPSCCSGTGDNGTTLSCNGYHSCTG